MSTADAFFPDTAVTRQHASASATGTIGTGTSVPTEETDDPSVPFGGIDGALAPGTAVIAEVVGAVHDPQLRVPPQPSETEPHACRAAQVVGVQPQTLATPLPPHVLGAEHDPQLRVPPQLSDIEPQFCCAVQVVGVHDDALDPEVGAEDVPEVDPVVARVDPPVGAWLAEAKGGTTPICAGCIANGLPVVVVAAPGVIEVMVPQMDRPSQDTSFLGKLA
ncbi:MAG TPA: hypothetical protein VEJ47_20400 [Candidatus Eremiobacteraceae bacterium]|nr:hypothetical protein [Candidatus Eremiobacteraceae bacterium]